MAEKHLFKVVYSRLNIHDHASLSLTKADIHSVN